MLRALTSRGAEMVGAAERFAAEFADGALERDRGGTFATEHLEKLRADRFLVAPVPEELGGGGVESVHDVLVASARLAHGDVATTLGVNMHFAIVLNLVRSWRIALSRGAGSRGVGRRQDAACRGRRRRCLRLRSQRARPAGLHPAADHRPP